MALTAPAEGSFVHGAVTLSADATDNVHVSKVDFFVDGSLVGSDTSSPYSVSWNSTGHPAGTALVTARAEDGAGHQTSSASRSITVDNDPPGTSILSGPSGTVTVNTAAFSFSSNEGGSTFACSLDGAAYSPCTSPNSYAGLVDGSHAFRVEATDQAGNIGAPDTRTWTVDTRPPPSASVADVAILEGDAGWRPVAVTVKLSAEAPRPAHVAFSTVPGSADPGSDYAATSGTLSFAPGSTTQRIEIPVRGDTVHETNEQFAVELSAPSELTLARARATVTILDDDTRPFVQTGAARAHGTTALATALVQPNGKPTTFYFEYGSTARYGLRTRTLQAGSGHGLRTVEASLQRLRRGVRYHFRVVATNAVGTSRGTDATFVTRSATRR